MSEWTPGPWTVGKGANGNWIEYSDNGNVRSIGRTFYEHTGAIVEDANAHLIAAAPDLYEALGDLIDLVAFENTDPKAVLDKAVAALSKARGEAQ